jgi:polyisoprenoid-binding protein YceI
MHRSGGLRRLHAGHGVLNQSSQGTSSRSSGLIHLRLLALRRPQAGAVFAGGAEIAGSWTVAPGSDSFVGYRVDEELAGIGATEAVGRTPAVTGSVVIDGTTVTTAAFAADLTTLASDDSRRDSQLRRQALETDTYPTATFALTEPVDLGAVPAEGWRFSAVARGTRTLHGTTRPVEIAIEGQLTGGLLVVVGALELQLILQLG